MDIIAHLTKLQANVFVNRNDDDFADRLNYRYTVAMLVTFAVIVSHRQFSQSVIKCWVPAFFTSNYEQYANQVCWVSNTYYVNTTDTMPHDDNVKKSSEIKYYQFIPFILLIQSLFLYIPRILWRLLTARAGLDMRDLVEAAHSYKSVEKFGNKERIMEYIVTNIDQYTSNPRRVKRNDSLYMKLKYFGESLFCGSGIYLGNYLVTTYFFTKIIYLVNSILQFYLMNEFLGRQFHQLGMDILRYLSNTYSIETAGESVYFPKVVMCDFLIREFGHPNFSHKYSIQCVLPINLYNQQIFTILWFWFMILVCMNAWALATWVHRMMPQQRRRYINRRLNMLKYFKDLTATTGVLKQKGLVFKHKRPVSAEAKRQKRKFIDNYLKFDGVFILRMISMLTSELVGTEVLHELWSKRAIFEGVDPLECKTGDRIVSGVLDNDPDENPFKQEFRKHIINSSNTNNNHRYKATGASSSNNSTNRPAYNKSISYQETSTISSTKHNVSIPSRPPPLKRVSSLKKLFQKQYNFLKKPPPNTNLFNHHSYKPATPSYQQSKQQGTTPPINRAKMHRLSLSQARKSFDALAQEPETMQTLSGANTPTENKLNRRSSLSSRRQSKMSGIQSGSRNKRVAFASNVLDAVDTADVRLDDEAVVSRNDEDLEKDAYKFDFEKNAMKFDFEKCVDKFKFEEKEHSFEFEKNEYNFEKKEHEF